MKNLATLLLFIICTFIKAQESYYPFIEEGKIWMLEVNQADHADLAGTIIYEIKGDTAILGMNYKKVFRIARLFSESLWENLPTDTVLFACAREEGHKVFIISEGKVQEGLLYDFDKIQTGDYPFGDGSYTMRCAYDSYIVGEGYAGLENYPRKVWKTYVEYNGGKAWNEIIVGVGSLYDPWDYTHWVSDEEPYNDLRWAWDEQKAMDGKANYWPDNFMLDYCYMGKSYVEAGRLFYDMHMFVERRDPTQVSALPVTRHSTVLSSFDLQGRRVSGQRQKGVYVVDGRKVLVR